MKLCLKNNKKLTESREICDSFTNIQMNDSVEKMLPDVETIPMTFILDSSGKMVCSPFIGAYIEVEFNDGTPQRVLVSYDKKFMAQTDTFAELVRKYKPDIVINKET